MKTNSWRNAFSLMEIMVVLLIVAIIAAATAPMVSKKMGRDAGSADSPWLFTGTDNNITFLGDKVLVGATAAPATDTSRLFIAGGNRPHIGFGSSNGTVSYLVFNTGNNTGNNSKVGMTNADVPNNSVMFGGGQTLDENSPKDLVAIGKGTRSTKGSVAIGSDAKVGKYYSEYSKYAGEYGIAIGYKAKATDDGTISIGYQANKDYTMQMRGGGTYRNYASDSVAIGSNAYTYHPDSVAIGKGATVKNGGWNAPTGSTNFILGGYTGSCVAIGNGAHAYDYASIAIGKDAQVNENDAGADFSIAIGAEAKAKHDNSVAIGKGAETTGSNQIVLGTADSTVYIPGKLIVAGNSLLGMNKNANVFVNLTDEYNNSSSSAAIGRLGSANNSVRIGNDGGIAAGKEITNESDAGLTYSEAFNILKDSKTASKTSDRRLKNVGKEYTAGLEELKKLEFFHYTFKKDKDNTPHVGVIAQDLQKVFPDAVTEGNDGYLRIRWDEMFYAVINAVKELDKKIVAIVQDITGINTKIAEQQKVIEAQQSTIEAQQKTIEELQKQA